MRLRWVPGWRHPATCVLAVSVMLASPEAPAVAMGPGATLYATCTACHGAEGGGNAALESPAIAGQSEWYLVRQLQAFRRGWRGASGDDDHGVAMAAAAKSLPDDAAVATVAAYVADLPPVAATDPVAGTADPVAGEAHYATCATCHGPEAEGMEQFGAPRLTHQHGWYLVHQLEEYREDGRGTHPDDSYGQMMAPMADTLPDDQAVRDVSAYIRSLTSP